jgi:putative aldouronate transport system substrate-binding protein
MKMKRFLSLCLAIMLIAVPLAGCSKSSSDKKEDKSTEATSTTESTESTDSTDTTDAASKDIVTLKWVTIGNGMPTNYDSWLSKVNEYLGEKIGVNIEMEVVPWGDWDNRRNIIINTNEDYDIIFGNSNNYMSDIKLGAYYDITDLIQKSMPDFFSYLPEKYWDAVTVDGKIYAVPTYKDSSLSNYAIWDKEIVDEYKLDINSMTSLDSLTSTFETIKKDKNDYPVYVKNDGLYYIFDTYDQMGAGLQILGVRYDDQDAKVVLNLEQDDIYNQLVTIHDWYTKGIINPDAATLSEGRTYNVWRVAQGWPSAAKTSWGPAMGKDVEVAQVNETIVSNDTVRGSINMISANTKYPEKCLEFLNLVNMDTKVRDMFFYGEEGVNFEYTSDNKVNKLNQDWSMAGYTQGTFFTVSQQASEEFNQWDEVKALNEKAKASVLLGFTFDTTEVEDQLANCMEIWLRYKSEMLTGVLDPAEAVPEIKEELMSAGLQDVIDEAQKQVDAFAGK